MQRARRAQAAQQKGDVEAASGQAMVDSKQIIVPPTTGHGIAHLSTVRNDTQFPMNISSTKFLIKNGKFKRSVEIPSFQTKELNREPKIDKSQIRISGYGSRIVKGLTTNSSIKVKSGNAWIERSFENFNKATISFSARAYKNNKTQEVSEIVVLLGTKISPDYEYKIVIGSNKNTRALIIKKDKKSGKDRTVYSVDSSKNSFAKIYPFNFKKYWVSIHDNLILVGAGDVGQNIFMSFFDVDVNNDINRASVGAKIIPIDYSNIQLGPNLITQKDWQLYFEQTGEAKTGVEVSVPDSVAKYKVLKTPFRVPGYGCFSFKTKGDSGIAVAFGSKFEYQLLIGVDVNSRTLLLKKGEIVASVMADVNPEIVLSDPEALMRYWISFNDGFILFGHGEPGQNLMFAFNDPEPIKISNQIAIGLPAMEFQPSGPIVCESLIIGSPVILKLDIKKGFYTKEMALFKFPDSFVVINPIRYKLFQDRQTVGIEDLVLDKKYKLTKVTQHDAKYYLMLIIDKHGTPKLEKVRGAVPSPETVELARKAYITKAAAAQAIAIGEEIGYGAGRGTGGILVGVGSKVIIGIGGLVKGIGTDFESKSKFGFNLPEEYGFVSELSIPISGDYKPSVDAIKNQKKIKELLEKNRLQQDKGVTLATFSYILDLLDDPYLADNYTKKKIFNAIEFLYNTGFNELQSDEFYKKLLKLLVDVRDNVFLIDATKPDQLALRKQWYFWSNQVAQYLMQKLNKSKAGVKLPPSFGEYFWLPIKLPKPGKCTLSFEAKGLHDIYVCFSPEKGLLRNTNIPFYEIDIRGWNGTKSAIRTTSLGRSVASFYNIKPVKKGEKLFFALDPESLKVMASNFKFRKYKINLNDGRIIVYEDGKKILDWRDPYPIKDIEYVGIGGWDVYVSYKNIRVS